MDGFHLADEALVRLGRRDRKGAIDTFDGDGYLALRGAVAFRGVNAVRDVRAAFVAAQVPTARPAATAAPSLPG